MGELGEALAGKEQLLRARTEKIRVIPSWEKEEMGTWAVLLSAERCPVPLTSLAARAKSSGELSAGTGSGLVRKQNRK